jgi:molybdopterin-guanine dinucleotide biosynthesis protein A
VRVEASRREPAAGAQPEPDYLEAWEVDHPPEFLVAPDGLDALPALAGKALALHVAVRVDATGRRVAVAVDAGEVPSEVAERLSRGVEAAFEDVAFMPARRDGRPVPAVMRWSVALDPKAPIALGFRLQH